jgi:CTP synthase
VPKNYYNEGIHELICNHFQLEVKPVDFSVWDEFLHNQENPESEVNIAICGKYVEHHDAYKSIEESLKHAAAWNKVKVNFQNVDSGKSYTRKEHDELFKNTHGILRPGGFGIRGIEGKINIVRYARENNIPLFGICLGMQTAVIEFAKNVCGIEDAFSSEFEENCKNPIIDLMKEQKYINALGGTMRLGGYPCKIKQGTLADKIYEEESITERHRHRYEFNNKYREVIEQYGMIISGTSLDDLLVEIVEIPSHPFFIGVQFHPEFQSRPDKPHKIFTAFVAAAKKRKKGRNK